MDFEEDSFCKVNVADINSVWYQLGVCYAFVEFENTSSAQSAIEVLLLIDIVLHSVLVYVREMKCEVFVENLTCLFARLALSVYYYCSPSLGGIRSTDFPSLDSHANSSSW